MWVQDIISPNVNITAEIPKQEADNFVRMCKLFAEQFPNYYEGCAASTSGAVNKIAQLIPNIEQDDDFEICIEKEISDSHVPDVLEARKRSELEITSILTTYIHQLQPSMKVHPIGSTQYNIRFSNANFNLLVTTSK